MRLPFRDHHCLLLLAEYDAGSAPIDQVLSRYFRAHPALGSKDKAILAERIYLMLRAFGLLEALGHKTWQQKMAAVAEGFSQEAYLDRQDISLAARLSFPDSLFNRLVSQYGEKTATSICLASNNQAPTCIRTNTLKTSREQLLSRLKTQYQVQTGSECETAIIFQDKCNFWITPEFKEGLFEVQDEASQLVASLVQAQPGQNVLDYCAGSGGKALAIAPRMQQKGQLYLHDIRSHALADAKKRLKRAGVQNAQNLEENAPHLKKLKKKMDWVLVDAPCSGTGTLRRNPDMKQRDFDELLERITGQQRTIFEKALSYLKPGGHIVYATCSILREENEAQVEHFCKTYDLERVNSPLATLPAPGKGDGFFGCVLKLRRSNTTSN